mmetsp:Transcript_58260/g.103954  ORF Transcript_58260/g.103954 Transcript_58260/m.103954 type:complete len:261 (-) Transcript_58260:527-1309(-)
MLKHLGYQPMWQAASLLSYDRPSQRSAPTKPAFPLAILVAAPLGTHAALHNGPPFPSSASLSHLALLSPLPPTAFSFPRFASRIRKPCLVVPPHVSRCSLAGRQLVAFFLSKLTPAWPTPPLDRCASSRPSSCAPLIHRGAPSHVHRVVPRPFPFFGGLCAIIFPRLSTAPSHALLLSHKSSHVSSVFPYAKPNTIAGCISQRPRGTTRHEISIPIQMRVTWPRDFGSWNWTLRMSPKIPGFEVAQRKLGGLPDPPNHVS